jgi:hypothetical protein
MFHEGIDGQATQFNFNTHGPEEAGIMRGIEGSSALDEQMLMLVVFRGTGKQVASTAKGTGEEYISDLFIGCLVISCQVAQGNVSVAGQFQATLKPLSEASEAAQCSPGYSTLPIEGREGRRGFCSLDGNHRDAL